VLPEENEEDPDNDEINIEQQLQDLSRLESNSMGRGRLDATAETERFEKLMEWFG
jgi:hypothetical protein